MFLHATFACSAWFAAWKLLGHAPTFARTCQIRWRPVGGRLATGSPIRSLVVRALAARFAVSTAKRHRGLQVHGRLRLGRRNVPCHAVLARLRVCGKGHRRAPLAVVLVQETDMYGAMEHLQGETIPVLLGSMRLAHPFQLAPQPVIARLFLLPWAGEEAWRVHVDREPVRQQTASAQRQVRLAGREAA